MPTNGRIGSDVSTNGWRLRVSTEKQISVRSASSQPQQEKPSRSSAKSTQVISKSTSAEVKKEAIHGAQRDPPTSLTQLIAFARLEQATMTRSRSLYNDRRPHEANHTRHSKQQQSFRTQSKQDYERKQRQQPNATKCHCCGRDHLGQPCKAKGKTCDHCGKPNHFQSVCKAKQRGEPATAQTGNKQPKYPNRRNQTNHFHTPVI